MSLNEDVIATTCHYFIKQKNRYCKQKVKNIGDEYCTHHHNLNASADDSHHHHHHRIPCPLDKNQ